MCPPSVPGVRAVAGVPTIVVGVPYVPGAHSVPGVLALAGVPNIVVDFLYVPESPTLFQVSPLCSRCPCSCWRP